MQPRWAMATDPPPGSGSPPAKSYEFKDQYQFKMICTSSPEENDGDPWYGKDVVAMDSSAGELILRSWASGPLKSQVTTAAMRAARQYIWLVSADISSQAEAKMDWWDLNFLHPNDAEVAVPQVAANISPHTSSWESPVYQEGAAPPTPAVEYTEPAVTPNPLTLSRSESEGKLTLVGNWTAYGWTWYAVYDAPSTLVLSNANIGSWTPTGQQGKTSPAAWSWSFDIMQRQRSLYREKPVGQWQISPAAPPAGGGTADPGGWSEWQ